MSYTPINWQTGQTITADKLNKMDNGWGVESTQLFSETVTTEDVDGMVWGLLVYSNPIDADSITVTFNGTDYTCPRIDDFETPFYGGFSSEGPDFSVYPFAIQSDVNNEVNVLYTETEGTYTIVCSGEDITISSNFGSAVSKCMIRPKYTEDLDLGGYTCDMTFNDVLSATKRGLCSYAFVNDEIFTLKEVSSYGVTFAKIYVNSSEVAERSIYHYSDSITISTVTYPS